jgi:diketogulonate reductase-like aldo/keto reductase
VGFEPAIPETKRQQSITISVTEINVLITFTLPDLHFTISFQEGDDFLPKDSSGKVVYSDADYVDTWKQMEECVKQGLAKSIGLSNFNSKQIQRVLDIATINPVVNQV